jgi:hypothetical protein
MLGRGEEESAHMLQGLVAFQAMGAEALRFYCLALLARYMG